VVTIAESNMGHAIHAMTVERGIDPRGFVLLAYGGGGGLFASATAEGLEIPTVVIPRAPSVFSAWGLLVSAHREDATRTRVRSLTPGTAVEILDDLEDLRRQVERSFEAFATTTELVTVDLHLDLRFEGQEHTVTIPMEEAWLTSAAGLVQGAGHAFVERHRRLYGHGDPHHAIEVVAARCRGTRPRDRPRWPVWPNDEPGAPRDVRPVRFAGSPLETAVFDRDTLAVDQRIPGPALVDEWSTTIVVGPGWEARVDRLGNLVLERSS
jgi:N-methylhydantoinase A